jgi:hypothetical protein
LVSSLDHAEQHGSMSVSTKRHERKQVMASHRLFNPIVEDEFEIQYKTFIPLGSMVRVERMSDMIREAEEPVFEMMTLANARKHYLELMKQGWTKSEF